MPTNDDIIEVRDRLLRSDDPTVMERNILRDCDIALRVVRCKDETAAEAAARVRHYISAGVV
jgi:hypothetical protein